MQKVNRGINNLTFCSDLIYKECRSSFIKIPESLTAKSNDHMDHKKPPMVKTTGGSPHYLLKYS